MISIISIFSSLSAPRVARYLNSLRIERETSQLISNLLWARQQSILDRDSYGVLFKEGGYRYKLVKGRENPQSIREIDLEGGVLLKDITLPESELLSNYPRGIFFKDLGNLDGHNGKVVVYLKGFDEREVVFSSNAGELNVR